MGSPGANTVWDLCVIGAGPAGYAAAMRAHDLGKHVVIVERERVGGAGVHAGALSSKTMWHLSNDFATATATNRGYRAPGGIELSYRLVVESVQEAAAEREHVLQRQLDWLARSAGSGGPVRLVRGAARFISANAVEVALPGLRTEKIEARNFLIATGSRPRCPDGIEVDGHYIMTSDHIESFDDFPESMVIVGAGVVGCEFATIFANFGRTDIRIIDRQPRILPFEDADVAEQVAASFEHLGITIHRSSRLESLKAKDGRVEYVLTTPDGKTRTLNVEKALVSVGRVPNADGLALETAGVRLDSTGSVAVHDTRTTVPHIWAAGDVTADIALVNVAELEGRYAVEAMFGLEPPAIHYGALSTIMFFEPEVASVGLNELMAKERQVPYRVGVVGNRLVNRNIAMRSTKGFVKLLAARDSDEILGLRVVGPQASSTIQGIAFLIHMGASLQDIDQCVHPHPAVPEGVQECARMLLGRSIFKPNVFGTDGFLRYGEG